MALKASSICRLGATSPSRITFVDTHKGVRRAHLLKTKASSGAWGWSAPEGGDSAQMPLHGVLHSTKLPEKLADVIDVYDARDAIETCAGLWGEERESCFAVFGVAPDAELWYDIVFKLETVLEMDTHPEEDALHRGQERC